MSAEHTPNGSTNEPLDLTSNLPLHMSLAAFTGIAWYNVVELNISVYMTFKRRRGLYFWSVVACIQGIACHSAAFILKLYGVVTIYQVTVTMITIGWYLMVTGQALVLYSRLHLVVSDTRVVRAVLVMICFNAVTMHLPTTVLTYGSNSPQHALFTDGFRVMEKLQMTMFSVQELVISGLYIWATLRFLRPVYRQHVRSVMVQLLWINVAIIIMDLAMLTMEYMGMYFLEAVMKGAIYSVKLKLEFAVLNQLMQIASSSRDQAAVLGAGDDSKDDRRRRGSRAVSPGGFRGWLRHLLPGPPTLSSGTNGPGVANTYYISPSVLQSTLSTRHHQQERNVSSRRPNINGADADENPSHGIAMTTEIRQEFSTAAELDDLKEAAKRRSRTTTSKTATFYEEATAAHAARDNSLDDGAASDKSETSQLELVYMPSSGGSSYEAAKNSKAVTLESPRPTAQLPWTATRSPAPPMPPDEPIPRSLQYHRPSVTNLKGGPDSESRTSSEAHLRM
jgi:hypothetical protein